MGWSCARSRPLPNRSQQLATALHQQFELGLPDDDPLQPAGRGRHVLRAVHRHSIEVPDAVGAMPRPELVRQLNARLPAPRFYEPGSSAEAHRASWAEVYAVTEDDIVETGYALFAFCDGSASYQLRILRRAAQLDARLTVRWPEGFAGYGWGRNG